LGTVEKDKRNHLRVEEGTGQDGALWGGRGSLLGKKEQVKGHREKRRPPVTR